MAAYPDHYRTLRAMMFTRTHNPHWSLRRDGVVQYERQFYLPPADLRRSYVDAIVHNASFTTDYTAVECRRVIVQFWQDGQHRVSHFVTDGSYDGKGGLARMSTHPTDFITVPEMLAAIDRELTRTDHPEPQHNPVLDTNFLSTGN